MENNNSQERQQMPLVDPPIPLEGPLEGPLAGPQVDPFYYPSSSNKKDKTGNGLYSKNSSKFKLKSKNDRELFDFLSSGEH